MEQLKLFYLNIKYTKGLEDFYPIGSSCNNDYCLVLYHGTKDNTLCARTLEGLLKPQIELDLK